MDPRPPQLPPNLGIQPQWGRPDARTRTPIFPVALVRQSDGPLRPKNAGALLTGRETQAYVHGSPEPCLMPPGSSLILDFGLEICGSVRFVTCGGKPPAGTPAGDMGVFRLHVRFGESVGETLGRPNNDHSVHESVVDLAPYGSTEFGNTGFRFVHLEVPEDAPAVPLMTVHGILVLRDLPHAGSFHSSDPRLNRIWATGAYTVHLNIQEHLWDGIHRDRLVWMGDLNPEIRVVAAVFDDTQVVENSLDFVRDRTPAGVPMNSISSYSAWWVINQYEWYMLRGNRAYLESQRSYLLDLLGHMASWVGGDGREVFPKMRFLDWPSHDNAETIHGGLQALLTLTFGAGEALCSYLGETAMASRCGALRRQTLSHRPAVGYSKQANALLVLSGHQDPRETADRVYAPNPTANMTTFMGFYILQAMAKANDRPLALRVIREYWGAMLDFGATTFWEDFDLMWTENASPIDTLPVAGKKDLHADFGQYCYQGLRHSLCHGWAGGPTAWLSEHILGVRPAAPGFTKAFVAPNLAGLDFVEGAVPTPAGPIGVKARRRADGSTEVETEVPPGIEVIDVNSKKG